ncbi:MAG: hypothetical protein KBF45_01440 [Cyclobacteriaceae bacterium]|nr:hypothetical protein [Cyclobacteriaceae bacterium]
MAVPIIVSFYGLPMFTNGAGCDSLNLSLKLPFGLILMLKLFHTVAVGVVNNKPVWLT